MSIAVIIPIALVALLLIWYTIQVTWAMLAYRKYKRNMRNR